MAVTQNALVTTQSIQACSPVQIANATGAVGTGLTTTPSNTVLAVTGGGSGSILKGLVVTTDDTALRVLVLYLSPDGGTTKYWIGSVQIPITAGNTGLIAGVDVLASAVFPGLPVDDAGRPIIEIPATYRIYCGLQVAVTSGKFVNVWPMVEDF